VYNENKKVKSLFIKNNGHSSNANNNVVYQYNCPEDGCNAISYIGYTTCTVAQRFYAHAQTGSIRLHNKNAHASKPPTRKLLESTSIIYRGKNKQELTIAESLLIKENKPALNIQDEQFSRVLAIF
jgi:hypothetical protein